MAFGVAVDAVAIDADDGEGQWVCQRFSKEDVFIAAKTGDFLFILELPAIRKSGDVAFVEFVAVKAKAHNSEFALAEIGQGIERIQGEVDGTCQTLIVNGNFQVICAIGKAV